jgi:hypothetical protein
MELEMKRAIVVTIGLLLVLAYMLSVIYILDGMVLQHHQQVNQARLI